MKNLYLVVCMLLLCAQAFSQGVVRGRVLDEQGLPLPGATVIIKAASIGSVADVNGKVLLLNVPVGKQILDISYIGYQPTTVEVEVAQGQTAEFKAIMPEQAASLSEVVVMGDRLRGQAKALGQQRNSLNITNVIASDQVGRFPDSNIGDALKRVPGITVEYDQGEARFGIIRGMAPRLNSVMFNGERVPSAEGDTRAVQLDLVPSDMVQTVEVNKSVTPDMDADAMGGAVNLVTRQAPEDLRISGTLGGGANFSRGLPIGLGSLIVGKRFFSGKLGVIASTAYHNHQYGSDNQENVWLKDANGRAYINDFQIRRYDIQRVRRSGSLSLDYNIGKNSTLKFSGIYNWRDDWENRFRQRWRNLKFPDANGLSSGAELRMETKGGLNSDRVKAARLEDQRTASFQLGGEHLIANTIKVNWSATASKASEERPYERYIDFRRRNFNASINLADPEFPQVVAANVADITPDRLTLRSIIEQNGLIEEEDRNFRLDVELPVSKRPKFEGSLKVGARYRHKTKERSTNYFTYEPTGDELANMSLVDFKDYSDANYMAGSYSAGNFATPEFLGNLDLKNASLFEETDEVAEYIGANYTAKENITAGYLVYKQQLNKLSLLGGVRLEQTDIEYTANAYYELEDEAVIEKTSGKQSYLNILPALHFRYDVNDKMVIRGAWTNTLARPNYFELAPYRIENVPDGEVEVGNAALKATTAMNFDLSAENYFESVGLISVGVFHKSIEHFIYAYTQNNYFEEATQTTYNSYTQSRNGGDASVTGLEFSFQRQLDFLPGALKGLGIYGNYTYAASTATGVPDIGDLDALPGTAKHSFNTSLSYENKKLVMRLSWNYTSAFLDANETILTPGLERYYDRVHYLDFNASYAFTNKIRFFFEANNLLNQPLRYYQGERSRTMQAEFYNSRITAGLKFDLTGKKS